MQSDENTPLSSHFMNCDITLPPDNKDILGTP